MRGTCGVSCLSLLLFSLNHTATLAAPVIASGRNEPVGVSTNRTDPTQYSPRRHKRAIEGSSTVIRIPVYRGHDWLRKKTAHTPGTLNAGPSGNVRGQANLDENYYWVQAVIKGDRDHPYRLLPEINGPDTWVLSDELSKRDQEIAKGRAGQNFWLFPSNASATRDAPFIGRGYSNLDRTFSNAAVVGSISQKSLKITVGTFESQGIRIGCPTTVTDLQHYSDRGIHGVLGLGPEQYGQLSSRGSRALGKKNGFLEQLFQEKQKLGMERAFTVQYFHKDDETRLSPQGISSELIIGQCDCESPDIPIYFDKVAPTLEGPPNLGAIISTTSPFITLQDDIVQGYYTATGGKLENINGQYLWSWHCATADFQPEHHLALRMVQFRSIYAERTKDRYVIIHRSRMVWKRDSKTKRCYGVLQLIQGPDKTKAPLTYGIPFLQAVTVCFTAESRAKPFSDWKMRYSTKNKPFPESRNSNGAPMDWRPQEPGQPYKELDGAPVFWMYPKKKKT